MNELPLHLLQAFVTFSESKNIVEAAQKMGLSQPGLSKQLKQLEEHLPARVFLLKGRKKELTPYGRELHKRIKKQIGEIQEQARQAWLLNASPAQAKLRILGRREILDRLSPRLAFPCSLIFSEASNAAVIEAMEGSRAEVGIVHSVPVSSRLIAKPLFNEEFQLVLPRSFFARRPLLDERLLQKLVDLPCLVYRPEDELIQSLLKFYSVNGEGMKFSRATESYPSIREMTAAQLGWAVLPLYIQLPEEKCWSFRIPAKALPSRRFFLLYGPEFRSLAWFKDLLAEIQSAFYEGKATRNPN